MNKQKLGFKKLKTGDKLYRHGIQINLPPNTGEGSEIQTITFTGVFDRRKLRRMLRKTLGGAWTVHELDLIIDTYGTRLRPVTMDELIQQAQE